MVAPASSIMSCESSGLLFVGSIRAHIDEVISDPDRVIDVGRAGFIDMAAVRLLGEPEGFPFQHGQAAISCARASRTKSLRLIPRAAAACTARVQRLRDPHIEFPAE